MMLSTFTNSALVVIVAALVSTTTSAESIGLRNFIEEQPAVGTPCTSDTDCGPSVWDYCQFPVGSCGEDDQPGKCAKATPMCTRISKPVCKCDGKNATNHCTAGAVSLRSLGKCPETEPEPEDRSASGGCSSNDDCGSGEFCKKADGDCDGVGECQSIPTGTNRSFKSVCGCDGYFYANWSVANKNATGVDYRASSDDDCPNGSPTIIDTAIE